jgi:glycolate oxidase
LAVEVEANADRVKQICLENGARNITIATDPEQRLKLWKGRKSAFAAAGHISPDYYVQDGVVPRGKLVWILQEIAKLSEEYGYKVANVFHAGDGNLHPLVLYDKSVPGQLEAVEEMGGEILKRCVQAGGTISGEHGIGAEKRCYMPDMFSAADLETMQWLRSAFDPLRLANPDKVFPTPKTCGEAANAQVSAQQFPKGVDRF